MKRWKQMVALLCALMILIFAGCGQTAEQPSDAVEQTPPSLDETQTTDEEEPPREEQPEEPAPEEPMPEEPENQTQTTFDLSSYGLARTSDVAELSALFDEVINGDLYHIDVNSIVEQLFTQEDAAAYAGVYGELIPSVGSLPESVSRADIAAISDGYLYCVSGSELRILTAAGEASETVSATTVCQVDPAFENYEEVPQAVAVSGNTAAVVTYVFAWSTEDLGNGEWDAQSVSRTHVKLFDVTDKAAPEQILDYAQDGGFGEAYLSEGVLYVSSEAYVGAFMPDDPASFLPVSGLAGQEKALEVSKIYNNTQTDNAQYTLLGAVDLQSAGVVDTVAAVGSYRVALADAKTAYLYGSCYAKQKSEPYESSQYQVTDYSNQAITLLGKLSLEGGISLQATACVNGRVDDPYAFDLSDGMLRFGTLAENYTNKLYTDPALGFENLEPGGHTFSHEIHILDADLQPVGELTGLSAQTLIYYERFIGDTAYVMSYEPEVYTVDLSDPSQPVIAQTIAKESPAEILLWDADVVLGVAPSGQISLLSLSAGQMDEIAQTTLADSYLSIRYHLTGAMIDSRAGLAVLPGPEGPEVLSLEDLSRRGGISGISGGEVRALYADNALYVVEDAGVTVVDPTNCEVLAQVDNAVG